VRAVDRADRPFRSTRPGPQAGKDIRLDGVAGPLHRSDVRLEHADVHRIPGGETRLITFSPSTVFGELALLDQEVHSATVEADEDLVCYVLTHSSFETLTRHDPAIAIKLLTNLGRELSGRLRRANRTIYQLAS
jgi:CRP-like cAMP-binding protein